VNKKQTRYIGYIAGVLVFLSTVAHFSIGVNELYKALVLGDGDIAFGILYLLAPIFIVGFIAGVWTGRINLTESHSSGQ